MQKFTRMLMNNDNNNQLKYPYVYINDKNMCVIYYHIYHLKSVTNDSWKFIKNLICIHKY